MPPCGGAQLKRAWMRWPNFSSISSSVKPHVHGALLVGVVDTDGAAAHLEAVHDQVVAVAAACQRVALDLVHVLVQHVGERMMLGGVLLLVLVVLEHGEVHHPQQLMASRGTFSASAMCRRRALSTALATS